jgi:hypothetical protein
MSKNNKTRLWFQNKLEQYKNDPEFLREYIDLLESEIKSMKRKQCGHCGAIQPAFNLCELCGLPVA